MSDDALEQFSRSARRAQLELDLRRVRERAAAVDARAKAPMTVVRMHDVVRVAARSLRTSRRSQGHKTRNTDAFLFLPFWDDPGGRGEGGAAGARAPRHEWAGVRVWVVCLCVASSF